MKWIANRVFTVVLYILAVVGTSSWDGDSDSWRLVTFRLISTVMFWWWASVRTIRHVKEDGADEDPKS